jgi:hypothetical protein
MKSIRFTFTCAASGKSHVRFGLSRYWMMVAAVAILDDSARREKERRKKRERFTHPPKRQRAPGPRF